MTGIRFAAPRYAELASSLLDADGMESCGVAYAHHDRVAGTWVVSDAMPVPAEAYERRDATSATLTTAFVASIASRSRATGAAVILIHTHPGAEGHPAFSVVDDQGERQLGPYLARRAAPAPHLALVIGPDGCRARHLDGGDEVPVWEVGHHLSLRTRLDEVLEEERDDRQVRAFGAPGQRLLKRLRFCVVGAGGTGSLACQQLPHLGATRITVIDRDVVEATNLNRLVGAAPSDLGLAKVEVAARMIRTINPAAVVDAIRADVVDDATAALLAGFDVILLCTDSHASRAVVNQVAYQHLVPTFDMGVSITVDGDVVTHVTGRIQMLAPGLPCLTCGGALDGEQIRRELQTPEQRAADPYVHGEREPQPAVISINSTVASLAITMLLGAVTPIPTRPRHLRYDGIRGRVSEMAFARHPTCIVCSAHGALAHGPTWPLPTRRPPTEGAE